MTKSKAEYGHTTEKQRSRNNDTIKGRISAHNREAEIEKQKHKGRI